VGPFRQEDDGNSASEQRWAYAAGGGTESWHVMAFFAHFASSPVSSLMIQYRSSTHIRILEE